MNSKTKKTPKKNIDPIISNSRVSNQSLILDPKNGYIMTRIIGQGTFGAVFEAQHSSGKVVAIKKVIQNPRFKNRELEILQQLNHPNCLYLEDFYYTKEGEQSDIYLHIVTSIFPMDLSYFIKMSTISSIPMIKAFSYQIFCSIAYLHSLNICHRDIKPRNVLVDPNSGYLQLCDFGSAKPMNSLDPSVSYIATRSYRAPELLYGSTFYGPPIDVWAAGCVIAEMILKNRPLFNGSSNEQMILIIAEIIGSPSEDDVIAMGGDINYKGTIIKRKKLKNIIKSENLNPLIDILEKIFVYSPQKRITALDCISHKCFNDLRKGKLEILPGKIFLPPADSTTNFGKKKTLIL